MEEVKMNKIVGYVNPHVDDKGHGGEYKSLGLLAGVHGNELETVICLNEIKRILDHNPDKIMKCLPGFVDVNVLCCANILAVRNNSRTAVEIKDAGDLNRGWGDHYFYEDVRGNVESLIERSNILIDMHCSNNMVSSGFLIDTDQTYAQVIIDWCRKFDIPFFVRDCDNATIKKYMDKYHGKIGLTWEQPMLKDMPNMNGYVQDRYGFINWTERILPAIPTLMEMKEEYDLGNDCDKKKQTKSEINSIMEKYRLQMIHAPACGIFVPIHQMRVKAGDLIGEILCEDGSKISISADKDERMWFCSDLKYVKEGDWLAYVNQCQYSEY